MKAQVEIRLMAADDLDQVFEIAESLPEAPHWPRSAYQKAIDPQATPRRIALVASEAEPGPILGFAVACVIGAQAELETIAAAKHHQRKGLGRLLLQALIVRLKTANADELLLEVRSSNHSAIALYMSTDFLNTGLRPNYYTDPMEDAILMRMPLK